MSSSCIEEVSVPDDNWYRIANELLSRAGIAINGSAPADIRVKNPDFFKRVLQEGSLGLGESYMDGWWECDRLDMFFSKVLRAGLENQLPHHFKDTLRIAGARLFNLQSKKRAWIVGKEHYDLGNDLFSRMLDPFMQYSCAYWKDADNLESAQQAKLKMICEKLQLKPGMRVLDIGCGWGGLAHYMASNYDVSVVGVTISAEQQKMAQERCEGLDVTILLQDYRDLNDQFDRIVSVGMFEHVVAELTIVMCFQSLILDMAGNVGTQSLAVTIRVLMDENLTAGQKVHLVFKEARVGLSNGLILGMMSIILIGCYIYFFKSGSLQFAFAVSGCIGAALILAMLISSLVGTLIPMFFHKIHIDPAVASGPLITTVNDLVAVVTYYGLAWFFLIEMLHY